MLMINKTYPVVNRYGFAHTITVIDKNTLNFKPSKDSLFTRTSFDENGITFIDTEGGPFISVGDIPANIFHKKLSKRPIIKIEFKKDHYIIYLK